MSADQEEIKVLMKHYALAILNHLQPPFSLNSDQMKYDYTGIKFSVMRLNELAENLEL